MVFYLIMALDSTYVNIYSEGADGGKIAVCIHYPLEPRYEETSPVVIHVPGGDSKGSFKNPLPSLEDVIVITFLFPGGYDPMTGYSSDGTYDNRGMNSLMALRDVVKYALGDKTDTHGRTLSDILPVKPDYDDVGIVGSSNGGNTAFSMLGIFGEEVKKIRWAVEWESPAGEQFITVDLGSRLKENPAYIPYSAILTDHGIECSLDFSNFKFDSLAVDPKRNYRGLLYFDFNNNDRYDDSCDYAVGSYEGRFGSEIKRVFSTRSLKEAINKGYPDPLGPNFASLSEAESYWEIRDMSKMFDSIISKLPDLAVIIIGTEVDHVQGTVDHPHVVMPYSIFKEKGIRWIRFLPDSVYTAYVAGGDIPAKDNPAGVEIELTNVGNFLQNEGVADECIISAAVLELSDRTHYGIWNDDIDSIIEGIENRKDKENMNDGMDRVNLGIFDITGRKVYVNRKNLESLQKGVYFLLKDDGRVVKFVRY